MSPDARTPTHRPSRPLVRLATPLAEHARAIGIVAVLIGLVISYIIALSVNGVPFQKRYKLVVEVPGNALPVDVADQIRIAGQRAGVVKATTPEGDHSRAEIEVTPEFWPLGADTTAEVRIRPASGLTYIELKPEGDGELAEGATIAQAKVRSGTSLPELAEAFDASTRTALSNTLVTTGNAVLGQGEETNAALKQLRPILEEGIPLLDALTPQNGALAGLITGSQTVARGLVGNGQDLPAVLEDSSTSLQAVARRREDIGATLDNAPEVVDKLVAVRPRIEKLTTQLTELTTDVTPAVETLAAELPTIRRMLAASPELRRAVTRLGPVAAAAFEEGPDAMRYLLGPVKLAIPAAESIKVIGDILAPYRGDLLAGVKALEQTTSKPYSEGATAPGNPGLRFAPIFTCGSNRNPYPAPGKSREDAGAKGQC
ncbi:MAG: hypothetical protein JHC95_10735 [Solirubrobacteraceae bacterium]|nr:hypothetical protein [Solirubrobacteraceae bacterium]